MTKTKGELRDGTFVHRCLAIIDYEDGTKDFKSINHTRTQDFSIGSLKEELHRRATKAIAGIRCYRLPKA